MSRFRIALATGLFLSSAVTSVGSAAAQPAPAKPQPGPLEEAQLRGPALVVVSQAIEKALSSVPGRALVVAAPATSDGKLTRADALSVKLAALVAGRHGANWTAASEAGAAPSAREMARNHPVLIHLSVEVAQGKLRVTADAYPIPNTVWSRIRDPEPGPFEHAFAQAPIDAEVRTYMEPVPIASLNVTRGKQFESGVLAMDCDDIDGDGAPEILSVSRQRISIVRLRSGKVEPVHSRAWADVSPVHPHPLQEPIGFAVILPAPIGLEDGRSSVFVATTDRSKGLRLDSELNVLEEFTGLSIPDGDGVKCAGLIDMAVTGPVGRCGEEGPQPLTKTVGGRYDAFDSARLTRPNGESYVIWVGREDGAVELRDSGGAIRRLNTGGAQIAVGDLDQDGQVEVLTGLDVMNPLRDAVLIRTVPVDGKAKEVARLPAGAGVRALAVCPPDNAGRAPFVVSTSDQIWVVR